MGQIDIPLRMPGGFKDMKVAMAHRKVVGKLTAHREQMKELVGDLIGEDKVDLGDKVASDPWTDLAPGQGHVVMVGENEEGAVSGYELRYRPDSGSVLSASVETPDMSLSQSSSETYRLEEGEGDDKTVTYFKFDDNRGVVGVLDPNNDVPALLGDANPRELAKGTIQGGIPMIISAGSIITR